MSNFIFGVLSSIVATILIGLYLKFKTGWKKWPGFKNVIRMNKDFISSGVINFFPCRKAYISHKDHGKASDYIQKTNKELIYVGFWLACSTEIGNIIDVVKELVEKNIKVKIILMNPDDKCVEYFANYSRFDKENIIARIQSSITKFNNMYKELSVNGKKNFELRLHNKPLNSSAFIVDKDNINGRILVDSKIYGLARDESYGIEIQNKESILFDKFLRSNLSVIGESVLVKDL